MEILEQHINNKEFKILVKKCKDAGKHIQEYKKMKWKEMIYQLNDDVVIERECNLMKKYQQIAKILNIYSICDLEANQQIPLVEVLSYDDYEYIESEQYVYFSRARYNRMAQTLYPPIEEWIKSCVCQRPVNPDVPYIYCEQCKLWYHMDCMKITIEEASKNGEYSCLKCQASNEK